MARRFDASTRNGILNAIDRELEIASKPTVFVVADRRQIGPLWLITLDEVEGTLRGLDESLEECAAWWLDADGVSPATADVIAVVPEQQQIALRFCSASPPRPGGRLFIYAPLFLEALREAWLDSTWSSIAVAWGLASQAAERRHRDWQLDPSPFSFLRAAQRRAYELPGLNVGFLWGPPGTGKTTTLGTLIAAAVTANPYARVAVMSTTNSAVDIALVSVDSSLETLSRAVPLADAQRSRCRRIGNHFIASNYGTRKHLLPPVDKTLIDRMIRLEVQRPDPASTLEYAAWKAEIEQVRALMKKASAEALAGPGVVAMTTTRAIFTLEDLAALPRFDLLAFDEASQVSLPHALALAPLARSVLFAGDPKQLSPIVQSEHPTAKEWLGSTGFELMDVSGESTCFLDEQSRMAQGICDVVSRTFYGGRLRVASDALDDPEWIRQRNTKPHPNAEAVRVDSDGQWSRKFGGYIRKSSVDRVCELVEQLISEHSADQVLVLTPFRAQRSLLKYWLRQSGLRVAVSTVHRAQGSERDIIVFDCVHASNPFLNSPEGNRLLNVAMSRAKRRLIMLWSEGDLGNPTIRKIVEVLGSQRMSGTVRDVASLCRRGDFPECAIGKTVRIGDSVCTFLRLDADGRKLIGIDSSTGGERSFLVEFLRRKFGGKRP